MAEKHKRRLRNYLLDRKLQLRLTAIMVMLSSLLTCGLGYFWYDQMRETSKTVEVKALATLSDEEIKQLETEMQSGDRLRLLVLVAFGVIFAVVVAGYGIVLTHKVAGPLFKVSRHMTDVKEGRLQSIYDLRRGDQLQEFFSVFKEMHTSLRKNAEAEAATITEVLESMEQHLARRGGDDDLTGALERPLEMLREMRDAKKISLES